MSRERAQAMSSAMDDRPSVHFAVRGRPARWLFGALALALAAPSAARAASAPSWDAMGGGVPDGPVLLTARTGYSRWLELELEGPLVADWGIGGFVGVGHGHFGVSDPGADPGLAVGARVRYALLRTQDWSIGLSGGLGARFDWARGRSGSLLVPLEAHALFALADRVQIGAGLETPLRLALLEAGGVQGQLPLLFTLLGEVHLLPSAALFASVGMGPALGEGLGDVAVRARVGVSLRL